MNSTKNKKTFQKSTISIVIISAITVGLITLEKSLNNNEAFSLQQHNPESMENSYPIENTYSLETDDLLETNMVENEFSYSEIEEMQQVDLAEDSDFIMASMESEKIKDQAVLVSEPEQLVNKSIIAEVIKDSVLFDVSSSEIRLEYRSSLIEMAQIMQSEDIAPETLWQVVGYADLTGTSQFNIGLAKRRAQAVAALLVQEGVDEAQLSIVSLGDTNPINENQKRGANQLDRRVEIHPYQAEITALAEQINIQDKQVDLVLSNTSSKNTDNNSSDKHKPLEQVKQQAVSESIAVKELTKEKELQVQVMENQISVTSNLIPRSTMIEL